MKIESIPEKTLLRDEETQAYSAAYLADCFEKELRRAGRFRRPLSLVFLTVDNHASLLARTGEKAVASALAAMIETIRNVVRETDVVCRVSPERFCIILSETDGFGSALTMRRLRGMIHRNGKYRHLGMEYALATCLVSATHPGEGKDFADLSRAGEGKYQRQRKSPLHRLGLMDKPFWESFDLLAGKQAHYDPEPKGEDVPHNSLIPMDLGRNGHFKIDREMFLRLVEVVAQDVSILGDSRGIVIAAGSRPEVFRQIFLAFGSQASSRCVIHLLGKSACAHFDAENLVFVNADDEFLREREVLLYLKENGAYGFFGISRNDELCGFNTAEEWLVDTMIEKMQGVYFRQGNF